MNEVSSLARRLSKPCQSSATRKRERIRMDIVANARPGLLVFDDLIGGEGKGMGTDEVDIKPSSGL